MARDYKHRAQGKKSARSGGVAWWKWMLVIALIALFVFFLFYLRKNAPQNPHPSSSGVEKEISTEKKAARSPKDRVKKTEQPRYDFYTILEQAEVVVPDYEIKTRVREERVGKAKATRYMIQAGSFREFSEADKLRARLALMGMESRVEKAKVGDVIWHRVKMGPFTRSTSVSNIKERLRLQGIDVIVTEQQG